MARNPVLSSPFLLGFDDIERALERISKSSGDGYPPYNIERIAGTDGGEKLRITLAVAGFSQDELDVTIEENQLVIRGRQREDDGERDYLYRGIAARQFQRNFLLAEGMEVEAASLENGLLAIDLVRPEPERLVRTIEVKSRDG